MSAISSDSTADAHLDAQVYDTLAAIGDGRRTFELEILSDGLGPLLTDQGGEDGGGGDGGGYGYIGVTKKALVRAFTTARRVFFDSREQLLPASAPSPSLISTAEQGQGTGLNHPVACAASAVILVFDSEHLTACNWRKRRILLLLEARSEAAEELLSAECNFTASLLRSPRHRHAKSPTLWYHRLWVMARRDFAHRGTAHPETSVERLQSEVELVLRAAEHHPMNYYAFSYLRQFLSLLATLNNDTDVGDDPPDRGNADALARLIADAGLIPTMRDWCLRNPGDSSSWMYLVHLLSLLEDGDVQDDVVRRVIEFGSRVQWPREALWTFVDLAVSKFGVCQDAYPGQSELPSTGPGSWTLWARKAAISPTTAT